MQFWFVRFASMRGSIGGAIKGLCYFICPPYSAMTDDARKNQALKQFSELGKWFQ
jgi:transcription-repair coupling factor (superfamily II helicase)